MSRTAWTPVGTVAALAVVGLTLAGCSSGGTEASGDGDKVTITYSNFISNGGNEENLATIV